MATNKRKSISKKVRFEVFKRDKFKCHYCGRTPPEVVLNVDHIKPVSKGGDNNILNLITACFNCNNGKRDIELTDDSVITKQKNQLDLLQEKQEQMNMMMEWHTGLLNIEGQKVEMVRKYWEGLAPGFTFSETGIQSLRKILNKYPLEEVLTGMNTAAANYLKWNKQGDKVTEESWQVAFAKISGVCSLNKASVDDPDIKEFYYMRGILRNRISYHNPVDTITWLKNARSWGATIPELRQIVLSVRNWTAFSAAIDEIITRYKEDIENQNLPF